MPLPLTNAVIQRKSAKDLIYDTLMQWIVEGTLCPGEKLLDADIAKYFSVSRTPVREALLALESKNLVKILPGRATIVSTLDAGSIGNLYRAISCLNVGALRLSFSAIDAAIVEKLTALNESFLAAGRKNNYVLARKYDDSFHQVFFDLAANPYLISFKEELSIHSARIDNLFFKMKSNIERSYQDHCAILEQIRRRDLDAALLSMDTNWMHGTEERVSNYILLCNEQRQGAIGNTPFQDA